MKIDFCFKSKRLVLGVLLSVFAFFLCSAVGGSLIKSAVLSVGFLIISVFRIHITETVKPFILTALFIAYGIAALWLTQFVQGEGIAFLEGKHLVLGVLLCGLLNCILFLIWPNIRFSAVVSVGTAMLLSTVNYYVFQFRGSELLPADFLSVGTALNVAGGYSFSVIPTMVYGWVIFGLLVFALWALDVPKSSRKSRGYIFIAGLTLCIGLVFGMSAKKVEIFHFQNDGTIYR